jgi:hypothetical protein
MTRTLDLRARLDLEPRDALFHLPNDDILSALRHFRRNRISYLLTTNHNFAGPTSTLRPADTGASTCAGPRSISLGL